MADSDQNPNENKVVKDVKIIAEHLKNPLVDLANHFEREGKPGAAATVRVGGGLAVNLGSAAATGGATLLLGGAGPITTEVVNHRNDPNVVFARLERDEFGPKEALSKEFDKYKIDETAKKPGSIISGAAGIAGRTIVNGVAGADVLHGGGRPINKFEEMIRASGSAKDYEDIKSKAEFKGSMDINGYTEFRQVSNGQETGNGSHPGDPSIRAQNTNGLIAALEQGGDARVYAKQLESGHIQTPLEKAYAAAKPHAEDLAKKQVVQKGVDLHDGHQPEAHPIRGAVTPAHGSKGLSSP